MATVAPSPALAAQARRVYVELLQRELPTLVRELVERARRMMEETVPPEVLVARRELVMDLPRLSARWQQQLASELRNASGVGAPPGAGIRAGSGLSAMPDAQFSLVDDDTIEREILSSRLALAMMDKASWEFSDLRGRMSALEKREELDVQDVLRPHVLARIALDGWRGAGLSLDHWRTAQRALHEEFAALIEEAYHETNRWLVGQGVRPEVDLRHFIKRTRSDARLTGAGSVTGAHADALGEGASTRGHSGPRPSVGEETRLMTRQGALPARASEHAEEVLGRLNRLIGKQVPEFSQPTQLQAAAPALPVAPRLGSAIREAQLAVQQRMDQQPAGQADAAELLQQMQAQKAALKKAAESPVERATIEIVALMFQSLLTEERIPPSVRVWFARLQMPVLRVAVAEPDFFATIDHPARRLIDRMGACVLGFDAATASTGEALEKEIRRIVQVVEAYPDTGRRVFQTVLTEFERFLENYFKTEHAAARKGVPLAQQVEQRETLAIQYLIELRKMLNEVPVQDGVRDFLFQVWADVLAMSAVKNGPASEQTRAMKRAAADLIWSASAKISRDERAEVIRRLPPLLKTLRDGMAQAGVSSARQDEQIQALNNSLAAAFSARAASIPNERLAELTKQLETLEELMQDDGEIEIDESMVRDISGHESDDLEVVSEGGSMPTPAALGWVANLQVATWFMLDYRDRHEKVQLAWQGMSKQLSLFVAPSGRGVLFQKHRLAAFLQAGLLVAIEDEALTVRATREALQKLEADPGRLVR